MWCVRAAGQSISKSIFTTSYQNTVRSFSVCNAIANRGHVWNNSLALCLSQPSSFLCPSTSYLIPVAGMKQMGKLRRRCRHCFFIMIDERLHVWCDVHPRHKQMQMIPKPKTVIITTHATQGKIRPW